MKKIITVRALQERLRKCEKLLPPLEFEDQHALLFMYRITLREELVLLQMIEDKEQHIKRLLKGNTELTKLLEEWIIKNPSQRTKKTTS